MAGLTVTIYTPALLMHMAKALKDTPKNQEPTAIGARVSPKIYESLVREKFFEEFPWASRKYLKAFIFEGIEVRPAKYIIMWEKKNHPEVPLVLRKLAERIEKGDLTDD